MQKTKIKKPVNFTLGKERATESLLKFPLYNHVKDKIQNKKN